MSKDFTEIGWVFLCGKPWRIVVTKDNLHDDDSTRLHGYCNEEDYEIRLNGTLPARARVAAGLHELKHAFDFSATRGHSEGTEDCTRAVESGLCSLFGDPRNDWFVRWAQEALQEKL